MYIWLSLWTGTGPSVHVPDTKSTLCQSRHISARVSPAQDPHVPLSKWGDVGFLALFALLC